MWTRAVLPGVYSAECQSNRMPHTERTALLSMKCGNATAPFLEIFNIQCIKRIKSSELPFSQGTCFISTNTVPPNLIWPKNVLFNPKHSPGPTGSPIWKYSREDKRKEQCSNHSDASEPLEDLLKTLLSDSVGLGCGLRIYISHKFS